MPQVATATYTIIDEKGKMSRLSLNLETTGYGGFSGNRLDDLSIVVMDIGRVLDDCIAGQIVNVTLTLPVSFAGWEGEFKLAPGTTSDVEEIATISTRNLVSGHAGTFTIPTFDHDLFPPNYDQLSYYDNNEILPAEILLLFRHMFDRDNLPGDFDFGGVTDSRGNYLYLADTSIKRGFKRSRKKR